MTGEVADRPGALESAVPSPDDQTFERARALLRGNPSGGINGPGPIDMFVMRSQGHIPSMLESDPEFRKAYEEQTAAGAKMVEGLKNPPINRGLPWLRFSAGMLGPTKTGQFGESLGRGIEGYAQGLEENQKSDLDFSRRAAEAGYTTAKDRTNTLLQGDRIASSLAMMRARMNQQNLTPALKEWAVVNNININDPEWFSKLTDQQRTDAMKFINLARGTTQSKNAQAMLGLLNPGHPDFPKLTAILSNQPLMAKLHAQAMQMVPREQFVGKPQSEYEAAVNETFQGLVQQTVNTGIPKEFVPGPPAPGGPRPAPAPVPGPAGGPAGPAGPTSNAADQQPLGDVEVKDFPSYIASQAKAWQQNPRIVQDQKSREKMDAAAVDDWKTSVLPHVNKGRQLLEAVNSLDVINPSTTPISGLVSALGHAGSVLGLPDDNALVKKAASLDSARKVVAELQNAILIEAKGVQTEGDARRALRQIADVSDMREVYEAMKSLMRAIGQRAIDQGEFYNRYGEMNAGQFTGANTEWARLATDTPLIKKVKFKDGSNGYLTYKDVIDQHLKQGDTIEGALKALREK